MRTLMVRINSLIVGISWETVRSLPTHGPSETAVQGHEVLATKAPARLLGRFGMGADRQRASGACRHPLLQGRDAARVPHVHRPRPRADADPVGPMARSPGARCQHPAERNVIRRDAERIDPRALVVSSSTMTGGRGAAATGAAKDATTNASTRHAAGFMLPRLELRPLGRRRSSLRGVT